METPTSTRPKFRKADSTEQQRQAAQYASHNVERLTLTKSGLADPGISKAGIRYFRLLPQPEGSADAYCHTLAYVYIKDTIPGYTGYMALTDKQVNFLESCSRALRMDNRFKGLLRSKNNPSGIALYPKYRELFLGFNKDDPNKKLCLIVLPSNGYTPNPTQIQAGTKIKGFPYERSASNKLKYGDIFDIDAGNLIKIETCGESDKTTYNPSVDEEFPLTDPEYDEVLSQVVNFEDIISYASQKLFLAYVKSSLTEEMFAFISKENRLYEKLVGHTMTQEDWDYVMTVPSNKIGYTSNPTTSRYTQAPKPAPTFSAQQEVAPQKPTQLPEPQQYNEEEEDDLRYDDEPETVQPTEPLQEGPSRAEVDACRRTIETMRAQGVSDANIPRQLFEIAGLTPNA